jgi:hypothetical protein
VPHCSTSGDNNIVVDLRLFGMAALFGEGGGGGIEDCSWLGHLKLFQPGHSQCFLRGPFFMWKFIDLVTMYMLCPPLCALCTSLFIADVN